MKARQAISYLGELHPDTEVYCLIYMPEDAELITGEDNKPLTEEEWVTVVRKMERNDGIDTEAYEGLKDYVNDILENRDKTNANK